jgi:solute carrier family 39 (zinc transporter), member 1/2/3
MAATAFDPRAVDLDTADPADIFCYLAGNAEPYHGQLGARIAALFVILILSSAATLFPVVAVRSTKVKVPHAAYIFARYFGAGVIIATAFIHLLDPAYHAIGPNTCVGSTGAWASFSWPPAIALTSIMVIFLLDFIADRYVEIKYGFCHDHASPNNKKKKIIATDHASTGTTPRAAPETDSDPTVMTTTTTAASVLKIDPYEEGMVEDVERLDDETAISRSFEQQIAAFLILEFGVIFHSIIIGLNLGVVGPEFSTLFPVVVFHQTFEGLGIGSRMSAIPFPKKLKWLPWALCAGYGLTTPLAIAVGLGVRTTYKPESFTASVVSGVLDSTSAGILIYTGLVELLARDFLFNPERSKDNKQLALMVLYVVVGASLMALLGKWA